MKLLLVDDDAFLRDMYATKFTELGHDVDVAEGAVMALAKLEQDQSFDAIVLDMIMPGLSGVDLLNEIAKKYPEIKAKKIVLSNQGQNEDIEEATAAGAIGYIIKAESIPTDVVRKVEKIMASIK
jgi:CheY-like chemotaxis protein